MGQRFAVDLILGEDLGVVRQPESFEPFADVASHNCLIGICDICQAYGVWYARSIAGAGCAGLAVADSCAAAASDKDDDVASRARRRERRVCMLGPCFGSGKQGCPERCNGGIE